jgi:tRNA(Ile2) C34 agmatinyltransferase TiaS
MATQDHADAVTVDQARVPAWRVCGRCGHAWRSRSRGLRFRCGRCEALARTAALAAAQAIIEGER